MKAGSIKLHDVLQVNYRADASYHLSEGRTVKRFIAHSPYPLTTIGEVSKRIFYGNRARRVYVSDKEHGIPFLSSSDILQADLEHVKLASKKYTPDVEGMALQKGWILISRSGTVGNCAFASRLHAQKLASEDVIRLVPDYILRAGVIYAYLASKYGHSLLTQGVFGAVIQHIEPAFIASLPIPMFPELFQAEVDDLIQESARLREEANDKLEKAIDYFNEHYPIKDGIQQYFYKKVSELKNGFAAYNNNLEVDDYIRSYSSNSFIVGDEADECFAPPMFKHIYLSKDNGYPFMTGSELQRFNLRYYRWLSPRGVKDISDYVVHKGTLLLYKSGTTDGGILGNVFIADNQLDGCCLSDHVIRIVFKDLKKAYWTYAFLKSNGGKRILIRLATGTMIPFITPEKLSDIPIPNPDDHYEEIIQEIEEYIDKSSRAKAAENKAITMVEDEIEKWNNAN